MGIRVLVLGIVVILVGFSAWTRGTADGTLADHWTHIPTHTHVPRGCWTGDAPKGVTIPGHVYATFPGGQTEKRGAVWTGKALDQLFANKPTEGLSVIAFCR